MAQSHLEVFVRSRSAVSPEFVKRARLTRKTLDVAALMPGRIIQTSFNQRVPRLYLRF
jgi:hypothetical protein